MRMHFTSIIKEHFSYNIIRYRIRRTCHQIGYNILRVKQTNRYIRKTYEWIKRPNTIYIITVKMSTDIENKLIVLYLIINLNKCLM